VRPKQPLENYGKLHAGAWIGRTEFLFDGNAEDAPKDSILLMDGRGFQESKLRDPFPPADMLAVLQSIAQVDLDLGCVDLRHFHRAGHRAQALERIFIRLVDTHSANRRLGVVFQEKTAHSLQVNCSPLRTICSVVSLALLSLRR